MAIGMSKKLKYAALDTAKLELYVNVGIDMSIAPIHLFCPPELTGGVKAPTEVWNVAGNLRHRLLTGDTSWSGNPTRRALPFEGSVSPSPSLL